MIFVREVHPTFPDKPGLKAIDKFHSARNECSLLKFGGCSFLSQEFSQPTSITSIVCYAILMALMLVGLCRIRQTKVFAMWHLLYRQVRLDAVSYHSRVTTFCDGFLEYSVDCAGDTCRSAGSCRHLVSSISYTLTDTL